MRIARPQSSTLRPCERRATIVSVYSPTMRQTFQLDRAGWLAGWVSLARRICSAVLARKLGNLFAGKFARLNF